MYEGVEGCNKSGGGGRMMCVYQPDESELKINFNFTPCMFLSNSGCRIDLGKKQNADGLKSETSAYFSAT